MLWPVIHNVQSSPTPSVSTSRSLTPIESESVYSQYQNILGLLLKIEVRDKNSENEEITTIRYVLTEVVVGHFIIVYKSLHQC